MATPWGQIIKAVENKKDRISQSLSNLASSQAQIANGFGGAGAGFTPVTGNQPALQANNQPTGGLLGRAIDFMGNRNSTQTEPQNYGAIGQTIMQQAPSASSLYERLMSMR